MILQFSILNLSHHSPILRVAFSIGSARAVDEQEQKELPSALHIQVERILEFGLHERRDLVELCTIQIVLLTNFAVAAENDPSNLLLIFIKERSGAA